VRGFDRGDEGVDRGNRVDGTPRRRDDVGDVDGGAADAFTFALQCVHVCDDYNDVVHRVCL